MSATNENAAAESPPDLAEVGRYDTLAQGFEHGLVLLAMGRAYWLVPRDERYCLLVEPHGLDEIARQLACYDRESVGWPPRPPPDPAAARQIRPVAPILWALTVLVIYWQQPAHPAWIELGAVDSQAMVARHEWWRTATALFLHADAAHVTANGLSGIFVFSAVIATFGRLRGWLMLAIAAVAANAAVAVLNFATPYRSIGASTAVFAAVGLLTGRAARRVARWRTPHRWRTMFAPLAAGTTVLALYGAGGIHIDVLGHAAGFVVGTILGFVMTLIPPEASSQPAVSPSPRRGAGFPA